MKIRQTDRNKRPANLFLQIDVRHRRRRAKATTCERSLKTGTPSIDSMSVNNSLTFSFLASTSYLSLNETSLQLQLCADRYEPISVPICTAEPPTGKPSFVQINSREMKTSGSGVSSVYRQD